MKAESAVRTIDEAVPDLGDVLEFMRLLWSLDHALQTTSKRMSAALGITGPQRLVVRIVGRFPGITPGRIASMLHIDPSTLTGILFRLDRNGLIQRRPDSSDGRRSLLRLTVRGRALNRSTRGTVESAVKRALAQTVATELRSTRRVLGALVASLERAH